MLNTIVLFRLTKCEIVRESNGARVFTQLLCSTASCDTQGDRVEPGFCQPPCSTAPNLTYVVQQLGKDIECNKDFVSHL